MDQQAQLLGGEFSRRRRPEDEADEQLEPELGAARAAPSVMPSMQSSTPSPGSRMMTWTWRGLGRGELAGQAHRRLDRRRELGLRDLRPRHRDLHSGPAAHRAAHRTPNDAFNTVAITT